MTLHIVYVAKNQDAPAKKLGSYVSFYDAAETIKQLKITHPQFYYFIDEKWVNLDALTLSQRQAMLIDLCLAK
jgi:hypothetical protein